MKLRIKSSYLNRSLFVYFEDNKHKYRDNILGRRDMLEDAIVNFKRLNPKCNLEGLEHFVKYNGIESDLEDFIDSVYIFDSIEEIGANI
jgi:hypothetical protein